MTGKTARKGMNSISETSGATLRSVGMSVIRASMIKCDRAGFRGAAEGPGITAAGDQRRADDAQRHRRQKRNHGLVGSKLLTPSTACP